MNIKCAHCKNRHETVADVKSCSTKIVIKVPVFIPVSEPGMYRFEGNIYRITKGKKSGYLFASLLVQEIKNKQLHKLTFSYEPGTIKRISATHRMTAAEVAAIGQITGHCWVCTKPLIVQKSIKAGIGPVCIKKV